MDCRGDELIQHNNRTSAQAVPFQYLINEQAKSILALQVGVNYYVNDFIFNTLRHYYTTRTYYEINMLLSHLLLKKNTKKTVLILV